MMTPRLSASVRLGGLAMVLIAACSVSPVGAQPPAPPQAQAAAKNRAAGQGYDDPAGVPARPAPVDVEPVWARPSVDTVATVRKRGVLRVGIVNNEPFVLRDAKGELAGFSIDLGRQLAADLGVEIEFVPSSWSQILTDLLERHCDVVATGLWMTPTRALVVNFSNPTSVGAVHLVAAKSAGPPARTRDDFNKADVKIVVVAGSSQEGLAARLFPKASLLRIDGDTDPMEPLLSGKAQAALVTTPTPKVFVEQAPDRLVLPFSDALQTAATALAIRKGDADFLNYLNSWLAFQQENGWLAERQQEWFGTTTWAKAR